MAKLRGQPKVRDRNKFQSSCLAKQNSWNIWVRRQRRMLLKGFAPLLKKQSPSGIEPAVRSVSIKFAKLPFGYISDSCEGHFHSLKVDRRIPLEKIKAGENYFFEPAHFEMVLDFSPEAIEFRRTLENAAKKCPLMSFTPMENMAYYAEANISVSKELHSMQEIQRVWSENLRFIKEFEKIVDCFAKKYGIGAKRG